MYVVIEKLFKLNYDLFERLIFYLARIVYNEFLNKMFLNGLVIIFVFVLFRINKKF